MVEKEGMVKVIKNVYNNFGMSSEGEGMEFGMT